VGKQDVGISQTDTVLTNMQQPPMFQIGCPVILTVPDFVNGGLRNIPKTVHAAGFHRTEGTWKYWFTYPSTGDVEKYWYPEANLTLDESRITTDIPPLPKFPVGAPVLVRMRGGEDGTLTAVVHSVQLADGKLFSYQVQEVEDTPPHEAYAGLCDNGEFYPERMLTLDDSRVLPEGPGSAQVRTVRYEPIPNAGKANDAGTASEVSIWAVSYCEIPQ
jgi:hypothetical protein